MASSSSNSLLIGPPSLHSNGEPMVTSLQSGVNSLQLDVVNPVVKPKLGLPKNDSLISSNASNPCLALFFSALPSTPTAALVDLLEKAWSYDPLTTLKLVCNLRGVRGTGKSDRESFFKAALWLHKNHPKTLAGNVRVFAEFGCYKDLMEIVYRLLVGENVRESEKQEWQTRKENKGRWLKHKRIHKETARELRKEKVLNKARIAYERYCTDPMYRLLHESIADMFAEDLKKDIMFLESGEVMKISLASKWCPSIDSAYDKATLICESIARRMFPRESDPEYEGIDEAHYAFRVRDRLRRRVLVPLHKALELPEVYMSSKQWHALPYDRVPSVAMKNYKDHFLSHDSQRFNDYIDNLRKEDESIASGALLPHEIIASLKDVGEVAELQWRRMVEDLEEKGELNNCIAVCDVCNGMDGALLEVCVALGLLISELSEEPWKGKVISFGSNPELHLIQGDSLLSKTQSLRTMRRGSNVDLEQVFDKILQIAVDTKASEDQMIKRVFVFSGVGFDEATRQNHVQQKRNASTHSSGQCSDYYNPFSDSDCSSTTEEDYMLENDWYAMSEEKQEKAEGEQQKQPAKSWESMYGGIEKKFQDRGFKMPEIVFWNLNSCLAMPVPSYQSGAALVSGFSKNLVKLFFDSGGIIDPVTVMEQAISGDLYQKLTLYD